MRVADFRFDLPERLIATRPVEPRDAARLLVYDRASDECRHERVRDLTDFVRPGDLLVFNDTRVLPHRLVGRRPSGGKVEVLILDRADDVCRGFVKPARKLRIGGDPWLLEDRIELRAIEELGDGQWRFRLTDREGGGVGEALQAVGRAPLPPYIARDGSEDAAVDRERYQTVFARNDGAVAAPTAGLHFTPELLERLRASGVELTWVTLHVGEGTFSPVRVDDVEEHAMHSEAYELSEETASAIARTKARGGRVVAVGTTAARTLESCVDEDGVVHAGSGDTRLFLYPGRPLRAVDGLLTNFHLPESTLLMLVAAFVGRERILEIYREAIEREYRFYSFGDAMLLL